MSLMDSANESNAAVDLVESLAALAIASNLPSELQVFLQPACLLHAYSRPAIDGVHFVSDAEIVERPQRMRAVTIGVTGAFARLSGKTPFKSCSEARGKSILKARGPFDILISSSSMSLLDKAVSYTHNAPFGPQDGDETFGEQLQALSRASGTAHANQQSEIPQHLSQGDLYLCEKSINAIQGALGTICEAVDSVRSSQSIRFVSIRPPGHHCGHSSPSGFCWVNNVAVGAAYAYQNLPNIDRIIILDIDLHHGNGTQEIVWRINAEANNAKAPTSPRKTPASSPTKSAPLPKRPLRMFYGSLHDISSYPCEDGDPVLVANASMRIAGAHGQHICNVHLEPYTSLAQFDEVVYPKYAEPLFGAARTFLQTTGGTSENTLIFLSAGLDASEHEYVSMSRHNRRVPTSFYSRFARDLKAFAMDPLSYSKPSSPRKQTLSTASIQPGIIALVEGGYSDRALVSATAALLTGFSDAVTTPATCEWDLPSIQSLERSTYPTPPAGRRTLYSDWSIHANRLFFHLTGEDSTDWDRHFQNMSVKKEQPALPPRQRLRRQRSGTAEKEAGQVVDPSPMTTRSRSTSTTSDSKAVAAITENLAAQRLSKLESSSGEESSSTSVPPATGKVKIVWRGGANGNQRLDQM